MPWHKFELTNSQVASGEQIRLDTFIGELVNHLNDEDSRGITIYSELTLTGFMMYFTPKASELAKEIIEHYGAVPCDPPIDNGRLRFMAGDKSVNSEILSKRSDS